MIHPSPAGGRPEGVGDLTLEDRRGDPQVDALGRKGCWGQGREGNLYTLLDTITIVDPACGEGHFLVGMLDVLDELGLHAARCVGLQEDRHSRRQRIVERNLFGVEVQEKPLNLARRRLAREAGIEGSESSLNLAGGDSLVERPGFTWKARFPEVMQRGGFDLVIGNPPYLRHEHIGDPLGELTRQEYKRRAMDAVRSRHPTFPGTDAEDVETRTPSRERSGPLEPLALSGRSDLSVLFTLRGFSLLRRGGALGFVLPSGLLDARYGQALISFVQGTGGLTLILESCRQRSFAQAAVNTAILVASPGGKAGAPVCRTQIDGPLESTNLRAVMLRWVGAPKGTPSETSAAQKQPESRQTGSPARAPSSMAPDRDGIGPARDSHVRLLERLEGRTVRLDALGRLRYPIKSGINRFFYPSPETVAGFRIESEFLHPVLKSPCEVHTISLHTSDLRSRLFICASSLAELERRGKTGALAYIKWGGGERTSLGTRWPLVPSVQGRKYWYAVPLPVAADIICPRLFDRRFFFATPFVPILEDQTFYGLLLAQSDRHLRDSLAALLNSSLTYLFVESFGRTGLGDGIRQYALCDMAALPVLDPRILSREVAEELGRAFRPLALRPIRPIHDEIQQRDRQQLDAIVAEAAGLENWEMDEIRGALLELTQQRQQRARSVHTRSP